ncbi:sterol uptake control 2 [Fusarium albosuccineum]|uniref:Sterol uptake control 2 n=1 Tax=Fusarium albosuccineum TaxID=1237068 RepID=A0A8H4NW43_9HYPO|nr:sterol uptake control 2 [Fusarium albosuccineum]
MRQEPSDSAVSPPGRKHRKPHRKSRNGCLNCKKRKVKCDETKPMCFNCMRFNIVCSFDPSVSPSDAASIPKLLSEEFEAVHKVAHRRGPGRPRKDWAALVNTFAPKRATSSPTSSHASMASSPPAAADAETCSLSIADADLMIHFVYHTAATLAGSDSPQHSIFAFWRHNVPKLSFAHPFVLHLVYALAGFHLAYLEPSESDSRVRYLSAARQHSEEGLKQLRETLPNLDEANCGALYVSAILVSYCAFAAGPTGADDLLVCNVSDEAEQMPLIHGVRLIRQTVEPATLFTGLLEPLSDTGPEEEVEAVTHPRINWTEPMAKIQAFVISSQNTTPVFDHALSALSSLYEANYGDEKGECKSAASSRLVFGWLYRLSETFISCLKRKEPQALLILAYWVPLLGTVEESWFLDGWADHLLDSIQNMLSDEMHSWLEWPKSVVSKTQKIQARI